MRIYLIDGGQLDGIPGLVKEIIRDKTEPFDLIKYADKYDQEVEYVLDDETKNGTVIYRRVAKIAWITEKSLDQEKKE
jgi:non-homologous end joining protein Ku